MQVPTFHTLLYDSIGVFYLFLVCLIEYVQKPGQEFACITTFRKLETTFRGQNDTLQKFVRRNMRSIMMIFPHFPHQFAWKKLAIGPLDWSSSKHFQIKPTASEPINFVYPQFYFLYTSILTESSHHNSIWCLLHNFVLLYQFRVFSQEKLFHLRYLS